jgi:hypothetical protein
MRGIGIERYNASCAPPVPHTWRPPFICGKCLLMLSALKWGALVGFLIYAIAGLGLPLLAKAVFPGAAPSNPGVQVFDCFGIFLVLFGFSVAGFLAGSETLRAGFGALAGGVAMAAYAVLLALFDPVGPQSTGATPPAPRVGPTAQVIASVVAAILVFGLAVLMGWLGGRPGAQAARKRQAAAGAPITSGNEPA